MCICKVCLKRSLEQHPYYKHYVWKHQVCPSILHIRQKNMKYEYNPMKKQMYKYSLCKGFILSIVYKSSVCHSRDSHNFWFDLFLQLQWLPDTHSISLSVFLSLSLSLFLFLPPSFSLSISLSFSLPHWDRMVYFEPC